MTKSVKVSNYLPNPILDEIEAEARRQGRSKSKIMQMAWEIARAKIIAFDSEPR